MDLNRLIQDVIAALEDLSDPERIKFAERTYPTEMKVLGVTVPNTRIVLKELKANTKALSPRERIELAIALSKTGVFECQHLALDYLGKDKKALKEMTKADLDQLYVYMDNWVSVDCYAAYILGYAWREGIVSDDHITTLYESDNFWDRRIALISTVALNQKARGGTGDVKRTLTICQLAVDDHHDMINKALSWALRELAVVDQQSVTNFMVKYREQLSKRVLREVTKKLETGKKN